MDRTPQPLSTPFVADGPARRALPLLIGALGALLSLLGGAGCADSATASPAEQGKRVYAVNCTACHNPDPTRAGNIGPAVAGSSAELVRSMLLNGAPPGGYPPDHSGVRMAPMPHLEPQLDALTAYLQAASADG